MTPYPSPKLTKKYFIANLTLPNLIQPTPNNLLPPPQTNKKYFIANLT